MGTHYTNISGTSYQIKGGTTNIGGTSYQIKSGYVNIDGTQREISFKSYNSVLTVSWIAYNFSTPSEPGSLTVITDNYSNIVRWTDAECTASSDTPPYSTYSITIPVNIGETISLVYGEYESASGAYGTTGTSIYINNTAVTKNNDGTPFTGVPSSYDFEVTSAQVNITTYFFQSNTPIAQNIQIAY